MDLPRHRATPTTSLRDTSDSSTGSWDAIEWTKIEVPFLNSPSLFFLFILQFFPFFVNFFFVIFLQPIARFVSHANLDFLLDDERVVAEVCNSTLFLFVCIILKIYDCFLFNFSSWIDSLIFVCVAESAKMCSSKNSAMNGLRGFNFQFIRFGASIQLDMLFAYKLTRFISWNLD